MSQIQQINCNNPNIFLFNSTNLSVDPVTNTRLNLIDNPGQDFELDFENDTGFTYDNTKDEFVAGRLQQKDQRPANSIIAAKYTDSLNANWAADGFIDKSAVLNGTPVLSGGKLSCIGSNGLYYEDVLIGNLSGNFVSKFKYTPNYSGGPSNNVNLIALTPEIGLTNAIVIFNSPAGNNIRITANGLSANSFDVWSPASGQEYVFEVICINNQLSLYIDRVQLGSTKTITPGQGTDSVRAWIGACSQIYNNADGEFDDFIIYSTAPQDDNYIIPNRAFTESAVITPELEYTGTGTLISFDSLTTVEDGAPRISIQVGRSGVYLYWSGSAWVISNGDYNQATDSATFNTYSDQLNVNGQIYGQFKIHFPESNTQSSIDNLVASLTAQIYPTSPEPIRLNTALVQIRADQLFNVIEGVNKLGLDNVKFVLERNSSDVYYNTVSAAWESSDLSLVQSNTIAEILQGKESFLTEGSAKIIGFVALLISGDGSTTPELISFTFEYDYGGVIPTLNEAVITFNQYNLDSTADEFPVKVRSKCVLFGTLSIINDYQIDVVILSSGYAEVKIYYEDVQPTELEWEFGWGKIRTNFLTGLNNFSDLTRLG